MSIIAASYFEDFVNDIGLWSALVRKHEELFGWALPFYDLSDYDKDYLNPQDFEFFLRYYNPGDFREILPNLTLLPEE